MATSSKYVTSITVMPTTTTKTGLSVLTGFCESTKPGGILKSSALPSDRRSSRLGTLSLARSDEEPSALTALGPAAAKAFEVRVPVAAAYGLAAPVAG